MTMRIEVLLTGAYSATKAKYILQWVGLRFVAEVSLWDKLEWFWV